MKKFFKWITSISYSIKNEFIRTLLRLLLFYTILICGMIPKYDNIDILIYLILTIIAFILMDVYAYYLYIKNKDENKNE